MLYSDGFDGYEMTTVTDGWKQVTKEMIVGIGVKESYADILTKRRPEPVVLAVVTSGHIEQDNGYQGNLLKSSTTGFLPDNISFC